MKYKLVAIDMDGTLLNSENKVSNKTREALMMAKEQGIHIILSTGRILKSALYYSKALDLKNPIVASNGAIIVDELGNTIFKKPIENNLVKDIVNLAREEDIYYHFYDESKFYSHVRVDEVLKFYNEGNNSTSIDLEVFNDIDEIVNNKNINIYKFLFVDENNEKLKKLRSKLDSMGNIDTSSSWANNIEAMGHNVSKGEALRELCNKLDISPSEVIAIGDSENDLSMFKFAGLGVAMGNGDKSIKEQADYITDSNNEEGVAKVIEKFVLK